MYEVYFALLHDCYKVPRSVQAATEPMFCKEVQKRWMRVNLFSTLPGAVLIWFMSWLKPHASLGRAIQPGYALQQQCKSRRKNIYCLHKPLQKLSPPLQNVSSYRAKVISSSAVAPQREPHKSLIWNYEVSKQGFSQTSQFFLIVRLECQCSPDVWTKFKYVVTQGAMSEWLFFFPSNIQCNWKVVVAAQKSLHELSGYPVRRKLDAERVFWSPEQLRASWTVGAPNPCKPECLQAVAQVGSRRTHFLLTFLT